MIWVFIIFLGKSGRVDLYRNNKFHSVLLEEEVFDYETPTQYHFDDPIIIKPGDQLKTTCHFQSREGKGSRNEVTYFGEGTQVLAILLLTTIILLLFRDEINVFLQKNTKVYNCKNNLP